MYQEYFSLTDSYETWEISSLFCFVIGFYLLYEKIYFLHFYFFENKDANQLCNNHAADQHLYFHYIESIISLLSKLEI